MATNVTEKDKTLNEIIGMCVEKRTHYRQFLNDFMLTSRMEKESCSCEERFRLLMNALHVASPCLATAAPCRPRCRIKARIRT